MLRLYVSREWKWPKVLVALMVVEFLATVAALAFFGIATPDLYRTKLWQVGFDHGFCSSPDQVLYAYANYRPLPKIPIVWSSITTDFNVIVSVLSVFVLLVKLIMFVMHVWFPALSVIANSIIIALWSFSIYGQAGPDHSDPKHPMPVAWYVAKSCKFASASGDYGYCMQAKGAFAVSCLLLIVFVFNLGLGVWSMIPSKEELKARREEREDLAAYMPKGLGVSPVTTYSGEKGWEMGPVSQSSMKQPFTPRTVAFHTLDRQLPLRDRYD